MLEKQTRRMLADPKARALVTNFANQWLYLRDLKNANPDVTVFPDFDDNLRQGFQRETEMLFESVMREDRSVLDLLDANYTFVNERLAKHYGIPNVYGPDFRRVPVPSDARRGLLGQGSLLLVTSNANRTSPVIRGKWILENLLGSPAPLPPPDVPPLEEKPTADARSRCASASSSIARTRRARLPQDHGPDRAGARELRRDRPLAHDRRGRDDRRLRAARGRHADRRTGRACARRCSIARTRSSDR